MAPPSPDSGSARPADVINEELRALWQDGVLTDEPAYQRLLIEWARAALTAA